MQQTRIPPTFEELQRLVKAEKQEHLLHFWNDLAPEKRELLARDIAAVDFPLMNRLSKGEGVWDSDTLPLDRLSVR